jgi:RNA polymerase sigma-70 factor (ECF subfamily)
MMPSNEEPVSSLRTRPSLLLRVQAFDDHTSWEEFHRLYRKLIYGLARRSGLSHADSEDIAQEVFTRVAETIAQFESNPARGSFRGWLMNLTRWRISNKFSRRPRDEREASPSQADGTAPIDLIADQADTDDLWEKEWQRHIMDAACERIARKVSARHYQVFDLYVRQQWPVQDVARELGTSAASVYLIGHRLTKQLKAEVAVLREKLG